MKKVLSIILVFCLFFTAFPAEAGSLSQTALSQQGQTIKTIMVFANGSTLLEAMPYAVLTTSNTITAQKPYYYYDTNGALLWAATLSGTFTYDGITSSCTNAGCTTSINNSAWHEGTINAYPSGAAANADITMVRKFLFITVETVNVFLTLTCDKDGNLY